MQLVAQFVVCGFVFKNNEVKLFGWNFQAFEEILNKFLNSSFEKFFKCEILIFLRVSKIPDPMKFRETGMEMTSGKSVFK